MINILPFSGDLCWQNSDPSWIKNSAEWDARDIRILVVIQRRLEPQQKNVGARSSNTNRVWNKGWCSSDLGGFQRSWDNIDLLWLFMYCHISVSFQISRVNMWINYGSIVIIFMPRFRLWKLDLCAKARGKQPVRLAANVLLTCSQLHSIVDDNRAGSK